MSTRLVARAILALSAALALALLLPTTGSAQRAVAPARTVAARSAVVPPGDGPEIPDLEAEPVLVVNGAPRTFQVVRVPVPAEFATDRGVSYDIVATSNAPLLGRRSGGMAGGRGRD